MTDPIEGGVRIGAVIKPLALLALLTSTARADDPTLGQLECDPLPFSTGRYGCQIGIRPNAFHGVRISIAQFSIVAPDAIAQIGGNDGFHLDVRPGSGAIYVLYYLKRPGQDGLTFGGSMR